MIQTGKKIIFFDGYCNLCSGFVSFVLYFDKNEKFFFASLQQETARTLGIHQPISVGQGKGVESSIVFVATDRVFRESQAVIEIFSNLGGLWTLVRVFQVVPKNLRDSMYRFVARNRYSFFGRRSTCRLPTPKEKERFLP